jgi:hypothetical protein
MTTRCFQRIGCRVVLFRYGVAGDSTGADTLQALETAAGPGPADCGLD